MALSRDCHFLDIQCRKITLKRWGLYFSEHEILGLLKSPKLYFPLGFHPASTWRSCGTVLHADSVAGVLGWLTTEFLLSSTVCYSLLKCFTTSQKISPNKFLSIRVSPRKQNPVDATLVWAYPDFGVGQDAVVARGPGQAGPEFFIF